ncbi:MAG: right-handed parallel beta-helix repeat-containing protein, partial [Planctomycetota bacterium]
GWTGTGSVPPNGTEPTCNFDITENSEITWLWKIQYLLVVDILPTDSGTVDITPSSPDNYYDVNTSLIVTANKNSGYVFDCWNGDLISDFYTETFTIYSPMNITANFVPGFTLIIDSVYGETDPLAGEYTYANGTEVTVNCGETPYYGSAGTRYICDGWIGSGNVPSLGTEYSCTFTITEDSSIQWLWHVEYFLTVEIDPPDSGTVEISPETSDNYYDVNDELTLTAAPDISYWFSSWEGDLTSTNNPETVIMDSPKTIRALFSLRNSVEVSSEYGEPNPETGTHYYANNSSVTLSCGTDPCYTEEPGIRYKCIGWTGTGSVTTNGTEPECTFTITENSTISWIWQIQYELIVEVKNPERGSVTTNPYEPERYYDQNTEVTIEGLPTTGFIFSHWEKDFNSYDNPATVTMNSSKHIVANFAISGNIVYVRTDGDDANDGLSPLNAVRTIQTGITKVPEDSGWTVYVFNGNYSGDGNYDITFGIKEVELISANGFDSCFIDGTGVPGRAFNFNNSAQTNATIINGFTIRNFNSLPSGMYGVIRCANNSTPTINNCMIRNSSSEYGAIYCSSSSPVIDNCFIINNHASTNGGGIYCEDSGLSIFHSTIMNNTTDGSGGGLYCSTNSTPTIEDSFFADNSANNGAGIYIISSDADILNCLFGNNNADNSGGGIYLELSTTNINNSVIGRNSAIGDNGGGIYCTNSTLTLGNCTIGGNSASVFGGAFYCDTSPVTINNSIIYGNQTDAQGWQIYSNTGAVVNLSYCDVMQNTPEEPFHLFGSGNINVGANCFTANPCIIDAGAGNSRLFPNSPCIDTGNNALALTSTDLDGNSRIHDGDANGTATVDIGAYEFHAAYVCAATGDDAYSGMSWNEPVQSIQTAVDIAGENGWMILVESGYYDKDTDRNLDFNGKNIHMKSSAGAGSCTIDIQYSGRAFHFHSGENGNTIIDGFTIMNGSVPDIGGAILCESSNPRIVNCIISDCSAMVGGGVYCSDSEMRIINCTIADCSVEHSGGGIASLMANPIVTGSSITNNISNDSGGGIFLEDSVLILVNCEIQENSASFSGGGIKAVDSAGTIWVNCLISNNYAAEGRGLNLESSSPVLTNCTITANHADYGGGIACYNSSNPTLANTILWANVCDTAENGHQIFTSDDTSTVILSFCDYADNVLDQYNIVGTIPAVPDPFCITDDPLFVDPVNWDYRLQASSPAIDKGNNDYVPQGIVNDLDGKERITNDTVDIGAYEYQP